MSWTRIRVSRFTRNLHPEDYKPGLPVPGELESADRYENFHIKQNDSGEWVGRNGLVNMWLVDSTLPADTVTVSVSSLDSIDQYSSTGDANTEEAPPPVLGKEKPAARERRNKRKDIQQ